MGFGSRITAFFGRDNEDALSVPAMDGVLKPNNLLDTADRLLHLPDIDNLTVALGSLHCSSGNTIHRADLTSRTSIAIRQFEAPITALASSAAGTIAAGVESVGLEVLYPDGTSRSIKLPDTYAACIAAALFTDEDTVILAIGSRKHAMSDWKRDLMSHGATGLIASHTISSEQTTVIRENIAFPYGLALDAEGGLVATEAWNHRIIATHSAPNKTRNTLLSDLPAYPARLAPASQGGYWLALFAPRRQLTELVLREDDYRLEMMATIPASDWIGPDFGNDKSEEQPLQSGSVRQMGIMKPWAPSRSYGMVVRLDRNMVPIASYHSRAEGKMHGISSVVELDRSLYAASRGSGTLIRLAQEPEASK